MVGGKTVVTNSQTVIENSDEKISLSDLKVGEVVQVDGTRQSDGSIVAKEIQVESEGGDSVAHH